MEPHSSPEDAPIVIGPRTVARGRLEATLRRQVPPIVGRYLPMETLATCHRVRRRLWPRRYTDANPFEPIRVTPGRVVGSVLHVKPPWPQWGRVVGGAWDRAAAPFWCRPVPRAIAQRYEHGEDWAETPLRPYFRRLIETYGNAWGHTTMAGFDRRCEEIDALYGRIAREGYRSQRALRRAGDSAAVPLFDEVTVDIGRDGRLLWRGLGQHRLAIANVQDVETIPVAVQRRHRDWQRRRDAIRSRIDPPVAATHPDLASLGDSETT